MFQNKDKKKKRKRWRGKSKGDQLEVEFEIDGDEEEKKFYERKNVKNWIRKPKTYEHMFSWRKKII